MYDVYTKYRPSQIQTGGLDIPIFLIVRKGNLMYETLRYLATSGSFSFKNVLHLLGFLR